MSQLVPMAQLNESENVLATAALEEDKKDIKSTSTAVSELVEGSESESETSVDEEMSDSSDTFIAEQKMVDEKKKVKTSKKQKNPKKKIPKKKKTKGVVKPGRPRSTPGKKAAATKFAQEKQLAFYQNAAASIIKASLTKGKTCSKRVELTQKRLKALARKL